MNSCAMRWECDGCRYQNGNSVISNVLLCTAISNNKKILKLGIKQTEDDTNYVYFYGLSVWPYTTRISIQEREYHIFEN